MRKKTLKPEDVSVVSNLYINGRSKKNNTIVVSVYTPYTVASRGGAIPKRFGLDSVAYRMIESHLIRTILKSISLHESFSGVVLKMS